MKTQNEPPEQHLQSPKPNRLAFATPDGKPKRGRPPSKKPSPPRPPKKPGGQPGNLNAMKHGLYVHGNAICNTNPVERAQLFDLNSAVNQYKDYINFTYEKGLKLADISQINDTLRSLSHAAMALARLLQVHDEHSRTSLNIDPSKKPEYNYPKLVELFNDKIDAFMGSNNLPGGD
jgi:hypothetical protein